MKGGIKMEFTESDLTTIKAAILAYDMELVKKLTDDNFDATIKEMDKVEAIYHKIITNKFDNIFL
jgi:hypothetical protein